MRPKLIPSILWIVQFCFIAMAATPVVAQDEFLIGGWHEYATRWSAIEVEFLQDGCGGRVHITGRTTPGQVSLSSLKIEMTEGLATIPPEMLAEINKPILNSLAAGCHTTDDGRIVRRILLIDLLFGEYVDADPDDLDKYYGYSRIMFLLEKGKLVGRQLEMLSPDGSMTSKGFEIGIE